MTRRRSGGGPLLVPQLASRLDVDHLDGDWLHDLASRAEAYAAANGELSQEAKRRLMQVRFYAYQAGEAIKEGRAAEASACSMAALQAAWQVEIEAARPMIEVGVRSVRSRERENSRRTSEASTLHRQWQREAEAIWERNPRMSALAVARKIDPGLWNTIRGRIRKPQK